MRNSGRALWLQGEELRNSVEQQRDLVLATREQLDFEREMLKVQQDEIRRSTQPILRLKPGGHSPNDQTTRQYGFTLFNYGKKCTDIIIKKDHNHIKSENQIETGNSFSFLLVLPFQGELKLNIEVKYTDERLMDRYKKFSVVGLNGVFRISEVD